MKSVITAHSLLAGALIFGSVMAIRFVAGLPFWFGIPVGLLLYALILFVAKTDVGDEEAP